jgi:outer membrane protein TolC
MRTETNPYFKIAAFGGPVVFGFEDNFMWDLQVQYPLYTGGKVEALRRQAGAGVQAAQQQRARTRQTVAAEAGRGYFDVLKARALAGVMGDQVAALHEALRAAQAMHKEGVAPKIDVLRPEVALRSAEEALLRTGEMYDLAVAALARAMGLDPGATVAVTESEFKLDAPTNVEAARQEAYARRPEFGELAARRQALEAGLTVARSDRLPKVGVFAKEEFWRYSFQPKWGDLSAGIAVEQNVFDGHLTRNKLREIEAQITQLDAGREALRQGIGLEVTQAYTTARTSAERVTTIRKALSLAEEAFRLAQVGYKNQVTPMLDVLQAQAALTKARADYEVSRFDHQQALVDLALALGRVP